MTEIHNTSSMEMDPADDEVKFYKEDIVEKFNKHLDTLILRHLPNFR